MGRVRSRRGSPAPPRGMGQWFAPSGPDMGARDPSVGCLRPTPYFYPPPPPPDEGGEHKDCAAAGSVSTALGNRHRHRAQGWGCRIQGRLLQIAPLQPPHQAIA